MIPEASVSECVTLSFKNKFMSHKPIHSFIKWPFQDNDFLFLYGLLIKNFMRHLGLVMGPFKASQLCRTFERTKNRK